MSSRWDPVNDLVSLREAMGNLLEESFVRPGQGGPGSTPGRGSPAGLAVDIRETPGAFVVRASVPGAKPEEVDITVLGDTLRISGEHRDEHTTPEPNARWLIRERRVGAFERTVRLPAAVMSSAAEAEFEDGVLTVTLPKAQEARPRSIPVKPGRAAAPAAVEAASDGTDQQAEGQPS